MLDETQKAVLGVFDATQTFDACISISQHAIALPSDHDYYYAAGIGDVLSIQVSESSHFKDGTIWSDTKRQCGVAYNYGIGEPHYPVPAVIR